jgi:hypothetical protein
MFSYLHVPPSNQCVSGIDLIQGQMIESGAWFGKVKACSRYSNAYMICISTHVLVGSW